MTAPEHPGFGVPREPRPAGPWPPTAVTAVNLPGQIAPITPRRPLHRPSGNKLKIWSGRFQVAEFYSMEVTLYQRSLD